MEAGKQSLLSNQSYPASQTNHTQYSGRQFVDSVVNVHLEVLRDAVLWQDVLQQDTSDMLRTNQNTRYKLLLIFDIFNINILHVTDRQTSI